jgi:hypothetical protein
MAVLEPRHAGKATQWKAPWRVSLVAFVDRAEGLEPRNGGSTIGCIGK